ncbi:MAG: GDSL-type esterase/lipase family protein, partial [Candidatus Omnitrophota bacterium]
MIWIIAVFFGLVLIEVMAYFVYRNISFFMKRKNDIGTFSSRYFEDPFLGYSSNPDFKNIFGEKIHNKYGFRSGDDFTGLDGKKTVIYCAGDSSTYCNFIERNSSTWPHMLECGLKDGGYENGLKVINAAFGGWTSYQSLIRFSAWVDVLKPRLVIVYHGKTDFAPFINGDLGEDSVAPDYANVMRSLVFDSFSKRLLFFSKFSYFGKVLYSRYLNTKYSNILMYVYKMNKQKQLKEIKKGLERINHREWDFILSRYKNFAAICKDRKIPVLFVTQKMVSRLYGPYMEKLNREIRSLESPADGCFVYDFGRELKDDDGILFDDIHFTEYGAKVFVER